MKEKTTARKVQTSRRQKKTWSPQLKRNVFTYLYINVSMFCIAAVALRSTMTGKMIMMVLVSFLHGERWGSLRSDGKKRRQRRITIEKSVKFSLRWWCCCRWLIWLVMQNINKINCFRCCHLFHHRVCSKWWWWWVCVFLLFRRQDRATIVMNMKIGKGKRSCLCSGTSEQKPSLFFIIVVVVLFFFFFFGNWNK